MTKNRLEAFSDGVIAIIITIMVLEFKPPHSVEWASIKLLLPTFLCYVISYIMVAIYWGNHHHLLHTINNINSRIIWANQHLLFWLSLVPFATAWMGETNFSSLTVALYALLLNLCGIAYYILLKVIVSTGIHDQKFLLSLKKQEKKGVFSLIIYTAAIPIAFINSLISGVLFIVVAIRWLIPDKNIEKAEKKSGNKQANG